MKRNVFVKCTALTLAVMMVLQMMPNSLWSVLADPVMPDEIYLSDMDWASFIAPGYGSIQKNLTCEGQPVKVAGVSYAKAIGTHAINDPAQNQDIVYNIAGMGYQYFETKVGIQDQNSGNQVQFTLLVDGVEKISYTATAMKPAKKLAVSVKNASTLTLRINCTADLYYNDNSIWAEPLLKKTFPDELLLSDYSWKSAGAPGWGTLQRDATCSGQPAVIAGVTYPNVIGTHAIGDVYVNQDIEYDIAGLGYPFFETYVGIQDQNSTNHVMFSILVDGVVKASYLATGMEPAHKLSVPVYNAGTVTLRVNCDWDGMGFDNSIWVSPKLLNAGPASVYLSDMDWVSAQAGWSTVQKNQTADGKTFLVGGVTYEKGLGTHTGPDPKENYDIVYDVSGYANYTFVTWAGIQDQNSANQVTFTVLVDGIVKQVYTAHGMSAAHKLIVPVNGGKTLTLRVNSVDEPGVKYDFLHSFDISNWCNAMLCRPDSLPETPVLNLPEVMDLTDLDWEYAEAGWGSAGKNTNCEGNTLKIGANTYEKGIGTHAFNIDYPADAVYNIEGAGFKYLTVDVGLDEASGAGGTVRFVVLGDGMELARTSVINGSELPVAMKVKIEGVRELTLRVLNGDGSYISDRADWGNPKLYKNVDLLPAKMTVNRLYNGMKIFDSSTTLSGEAAGLSDLKIYVDGILNTTKTLDDFTWQTPVTVASEGSHTIRIDGCKNGEVLLTKSYTVEKINFAPSTTYTVKTTATELTIGRMGDLLCVTGLKDTESGDNWLENSTEVRMPDRIKIDGADKKITWKYQSVSTNTVSGVRTLTIKYTCAEYAMTLESIWTSYPNDAAPVKHHMNMVNNSGKEITVYSVPSLQLNLRGRASEKLELMTITKGATTPDGMGIYYYDITNGAAKNIYSTAEYNDGGKFDAGYIPYAGIQGDGRGVYAGLEWPQGSIYSEGAALTAEGQSFTLTDGLNSDFKTDIPNGESYFIPAAFVGCYTGTRDDGSNEMTKWYYNFMMPEENKSDKYPDLQTSYWWTTARTRREWVSTDKNFFKAVDQLSALGFTCGVLDIGWNSADGLFEAAQDRWPGGLAKQAQYSQDHGMDFGVYFRPFNGMSSVPGSLTSVPGVGDKEWFVSDAGGATLDLGNDEAKQVLLTGLRKLISESGLDVLRTDFGGIVGWSNRINRHKYGVDTTYWTARGFYDVIGQLKTEFPDLRWEACSCGGTLKDFMTMQYATRIQSTDTYSALDVRRTFYDASYTFPAMQILQWFNDFIYDNMPTKDYDYRFRSVLMGSAAYFVQLPDDMCSEEKASFVRATEIYNEWMKPLVKNANLYHVLPRANGVDWDGMEYMDPDTGKGAVLVFKGSTAENTKNVKLAGLDAAKTYHIWTEDKTLAYQKVTGQKLMTDGITFQLDGQFQSEILYIQEVGNNDSAITAPGAFNGKGDTSVTADAANTVTVSWNAAAGADSYRVAVFEGSGTTPAAEKEQTGVSITIDGLKAGTTYHWAVTALNRFGETAMTGNYSIQSTGTSYLETLTGLTVNGSIHQKGGVEAQGILYLESLAVKTNDALLTPNEDVVLTADLDPAAGYQTLAGTLALAEKITGEAASVTLSTDLNVTKTMLLNGNNYDREFALDITGASKLTITVKNVSSDILSQSDTLLARTYSSSNPFASYYRILGSTAGTEYVFSADVSHNVTGVISDTPRYGIFAGYTDENNYVGIYLDRQYSLVTTTAMVNGVSQGTMHIPLAENFDSALYHNLAAYRNGDTFKLYLDGKLIDVRTAAIGASKPGLSLFDTAAVYKNVKMKQNNAETAMTLEVPNAGIWKGLAPTVVIGKPGLFGETLTVNEAEPAAVAKDPDVQIDLNASITDIPDNGSSQSIGFDESSDYLKFNYYSSNHIQGCEIVNGKLVSKDNGEQKAILKTPAAMKSGFVQVDIGLNQAGSAMNGGLYIMAKNAADTQDAVTAVNIQLESMPGSRALMVGIHKFSSTGGWMGVITSTTLENYFANGNEKAAVTLKAAVDDGVLNVYVDGSLILTMMNISISSYEAGAIGLRSQYSSLQFDNLKVVDYEEAGVPEDPEEPEEDPDPDESKTKTDIFDFSSAAQGDQLSKYSSSNGGFEIENGQLVPTGEAGEFKALLKGTRTYRSIQVDIIPGASGKINSGIYIGASGAGDATDSIKALGILVQSDFEGWEDAGNRIDLIIGSFPNWTELSRTIIETGAGNALYTNGVKQPLRLRVDIDGDNLTITLSLASDPDKKIVKQYVYTGASKGTVGLRSFFNDSAFDNLSVTYLADTTDNGGSDNNPQTGDAYPVLLLLLLGASVTVIRKNRKKKSDNQQAA